MNRCLIISASNVQNIRIRKNFYFFIKKKVDDVKFVGDFFVDSEPKQIIWKGAYNRGGKIKEFIIFYRLLKIIIQNKPTHLISFAPKVNIYCGIISMLLNIKHAAVISGLGSMYKQITSSNSLYFKLLLFSLKRTGLIITMNEENYLFFKNKFKINTIERIPSEGLNTKVGNKIYKSKNDTNLLYLSRIISEKGIFIIIDAFNKIKKIFPNLKLLIAGEMSLNENGEKKSFFKKIKSERIKFFGEVSESVKKNLLKKSNIVLLPSMYGEGLPMILLEGQLNESLVITTNVTGCKDAIPDFLSDYAFCRFNSNSLAKKISEIIKIDNSLSDYLTKKSKAWVKENHDFDKINSVYQSIFDKNNFFK